MVKKWIKYLNIRLFFAMLNLGNAENNLRRRYHDNSGNERT